MNANILAQLIIAIGPAALDLAARLADIWNKPSLTPDEVKALCAPAKKSYDEYITEARARRTP